MIFRGKIGRLPDAIQEAVNVRLHMGEKGRDVAGWLNALPEVQQLLAAEFGGKPVREQNVSEWRKNGHQHWLRWQESQKMLERMGADGVKLSEAAGHPAEGRLTDMMATWLAARYLMAAKQRQGKGDDPATAWNRLREFCNDFVALRRGDLRARRLELERDKLAEAKRVRTLQGSEAQKERPGSLL